MINFTIDGKTVRLLLLLVLGSVVALVIDFALDGTLDIFNFVVDAIESVRR